MTVTTLDEKIIQDIGHAFSCYDYGEEHGLIDAFPGREAVAAFSEGNGLGVLVILDTDARSKCDKYIHLGMELAGTRRFGENGVLDDLAVVDDENAVGIAHGLEPVGDHNDRLVVGQLGDGLHQLFFVLRVHSGYCWRWCRRTGASAGTRRRNCG